MIAPEYSNSIDITAREQARQRARLTGLNEAGQGTRIQVQFGPHTIEYHDLRNGCIRITDSDGEVFPFHRREEANEAWKALCRFYEDEGDYTAEVVT